MTESSSVRSFVRPLLVAAALSWTHAAAAQTDLARARDLYRAAAYDDALAVLNPLDGGQSDVDAPVVGEYRALCLIALGRSVEADRVMEAVVLRAPGYHLSGDDTPPRVRARFADVRRRMLPAIVQQKYADAKAAYDRKDAPLAVKGFQDVLAVLDDADIAAAANASPLAEIRSLAADFFKLSEAAAAPKLVPPPAAPPPPPPMVQPPPPPPAAPQIYGPEDANVVPPTTVRQVLPPVDSVFAVRQGVVEIIIGESGAVEAAEIRTPVNPVYDKLVLSAAKTWRYRAATLDGQPVKFRKLVQIDIKPR